MNADYAATIDHNSVALFCIDAPLSSYLASLIARNQLHQTQIALLNRLYLVFPLSGTTSGHTDMIVHHLDGTAFDCVQHASVRSMFKLVADVRQRYRGKPVYVYHRADNAIGRLIRHLLPQAIHIVLEHGNSETWSYIRSCQKRRTNEKSYGKKIYLLSFYDEVCTYLERHNITPNIRAYPLKPLVAPFLESYRHELHNDRSLFFMSPLVDDWMIAADEVRFALSRFLARRPERHYLLKPHPRRCGATMQITCEVLDQHGCSYEVLSPSNEIAEVAFLKSDVSEVCSFFSTATFWIHKFYGVPFDSMVPELLNTQSRTAEFQEAVKIFHKLFCHEWGRV
ncbi:MAG: hypothetical protein R3A44_16265 [Caldilineaceae bacterium]